MFERFLSRMQTASFPHLLVIALIGFYAALRLGVFSGLSGDEAEQVLFAQSFQWGYDPANPPLYTWILLALFTVFGKHVAVVLGLKFTVLAAIYFAMYQAGRISLGGERRFEWAVIGLSPVLIFFVAWQSIFSYSHSLLNALFVVVTFSIVVKLIRTRQLVWYAALGLCIGLGLQSKYAFGMFMLAVLGAGLSLPDIRKAFLDKRILLSLALAVAVFAPHGAWLLASLQALQDAIAYKLETGKDVTYFKGLGMGALALVKALFAFVSPMWLVLLAVFPMALFKPAGSDAAQDIDRLLGRTFIGVLLLMAALVIGGITQFRPNYLFLFILLPIWVFARLPVMAEPDKRRKIYAGAVLAGGLLSAGGLAAKAITDPMRCDKCQILMPYEQIAQELKNHGFHGGSVLAHWYPNPLPGNLLMYLDDVRMVSTKFPTIVPPQNGENGQCLLATFALEDGGSDMVNLSARAKEAFSTDIPKDLAMQRFSVPYIRRPDKKVRIDYALLDPGPADCH